MRHIVKQGRDGKTGGNGTGHQFCHALCAGNDSNVFYQYCFDRSKYLPECGDQCGNCFDIRIPWNSGAYHALWDWAVQKFVGFLQN